MLTPTEEGIAAGDDERESERRRNHAFGDGVRRNAAHPRAVDKAKRVSRTVTESLEIAPDVEVAMKHEQRQPCHAQGP